MSESRPEIKEINEPNTCAIVPYTIKGNDIAFNSRQDFVNEFKKWAKDTMSTRIMNAGMGGNRSALKSRYELFTQFLDSGKPIEWLVRFAMRKGYSPDSVERLNIEFQDMVDEFKETLIQNSFVKKEEKGEFII